MVDNFYDKLSTKIINAGSGHQLSDRFNVRFLGIPENLSDFMSRQIKSVTPRTISFETIRHRSGQATFNDIGKIDVEPLTIILSHDDAGILDSILMAQVMRQKGIDVSGFPQVSGKANNAKFDVKLEYIDINGDVTRYDLYRKCFIRSLIPNDLTADDGAPTTSTVVMAFDGVDYSYEEDMFAFN